ncbi:MAG: hypothetical protein ACK457_12255 [Flavobacteriia bacterium]|jgi:hypothetical protein
MKNIYQLCNEISNRKDFENFLKEFKNNLKQFPQEWSNDTLELFLEGLYGYNYDSDPNDIPTWKEMAEMLLASRVYE